MKISVDDNACDGHGSCAMFDPDLFPLDGRGHSAVGADRVVPTGREAMALAGAASCPVNAIRVDR